RGEATTMPVASAWLRRGPSGESKRAREAAPSRARPRVRLRDGRGESAHGRARADGNLEACGNAGVSASRRGSLGGCTRRQYESARPESTRTEGWPPRFRALAMKPMDLIKPALVSRPGTGH